MEATPKERIYEFIKKNGMNASEFHQRLGKSVSYLPNMVIGPSRKVQREMAEIFPDLNMDWIMTGRGEMMINSDNVINFRRAKNVNSGTAEHVGDNNGSADKDMIDVVNELIKANAEKDKQIDKLINLLSLKLGVGE